ncbi:MAG: ABC transporter ATP-binding protein [Streptosporangiaceae bacterium]
MNAVSMVPADRQPVEGDTADSPLLEIADLAASYPVKRTIGGVLRREPRRAVRAVDGVSLTLRKGEMVALVGESGCGKTTTAQTILRMVEPTGGSIRFKGQDITGFAASRLRPLRRRMQMIYQDPYESLDPRFRVGAAIEEPLVIHGVEGSKEERSRRVRDALARAGLNPPEQYLGRFPHELSGGQRQRVAIAASIVLEPELLVADEPVSMLDVSVRAGVLSLLGDLRRNGELAILMITHDLSTAAHFADRIAVMYLGRIVEEGPAHTVVRDPQHPYTKALVAAVPPRDPRDHRSAQPLSGEPPDAAAIPAGCRFQPRCPLAEERCKSIDPQLQPIKGGSAPGHQAACVLL